ncbi:MAG: DUF2948 family protein [Pseudomonadota bacterium]
MSSDARFEDAPLSDRPLRLRAEGADDLSVISSLVQDGVARAAEVSWLRRKRRLVILINRFRWEDAVVTSRGARPFERVRTALTIADVAAVRAQGLATDDPDAVLSLLSLSFESREDGAGKVVIACAGEATIMAEVEALAVELEDLTRPWEASADQAPDHGET